MREWGLILHILLVLVVAVVGIAIVVAVARHCEDCTPPPDMGTHTLTPVFIPSGSGGMSVILI